MDDRQPTIEETLDKVKKGIIDDWSDANPPKYDFAENKRRQNKAKVIPISRAKGKRE